MKVILDADMASVFAKVDKLQLLVRLFVGKEIVITPRVSDELHVPLLYGYDFPLKIFQAFRVLIPNQRETNRYNKLRQERPGLGKGELEAIAVCQARGFIFAVIDRSAARFAKEQSVEVASLHSVLRALWVSKIMTQEEVS